MQKHPKTFCSFVAAFMLVAVIAQAQIVKGAFVGTVADRSGAVLPGVSITARNLATNVAATTVTDSVGSYIVPFLDPGVYSITAEGKGFKSAIEPGVKLDIAAKTRVDFKLDVGTVSDTINVSDAAPLVQTDTATVGLVITGEKLKSLPLIDRNYQALAQLAPTAVAPTVANMTIFKSGSLTAGAYYQVGGQRGSYIAYTTDGVDNQDMWWESQGLIPPLDTIEEFNVQTSNFSAEYGRGAVQFTTTTRQGTNAFHGSVYEYLQNDVLDANKYFDNQAHRPKAPFRDNQFGLTLGGPIYRNKTFFFFGYGGRRHRESATAFATWPEAQWLNGDFSDLRNPDGTLRIIYDPATTRPNGQGGFIRDPFPGNIIPGNRIDPVALAAVKYIPAPNAPGIRPGFNAVGNVRTVQNVNQWVLRLDHNLSQKDRLYGRYLQSKEDGLFTALAPLSGHTVTNNGRNVMLGETHTFSNALLNELRIGYNRANYLPFQEGANGSTNYWQQFGLHNLSTNPKQFGLPNFSWSGYSAIGGPGSDPLGAVTNTFHISDNLIDSVGKHTIKTGVDLRRTYFNEIAGFGSRGSFGFSNNFTSLPGSATSTGSPFGDFLLGISSSASGLLGDTEARLTGTMYGAYIQDDWRIANHLTMSIGVRYENYRPWTEKDGKIPKFDFGMIPGTCFGVGCPPGKFIPTGPGKPWYNAHNKDWGPRIGLSYSPFGNNRTAIRAAYGLFYSPTDMNEYVNGVFNPPTSLSFIVSPQNPYTDITSTKLTNLFPGGVLPPPNQTLSTDNWTLPAISPYPFLQNNKDASVSEWQLSVQHSLAQSFVLEIGYLGSHAVHGQRRVDYNQSRLDNPGQTTPVASRAPYPSLGIFTADDHSAKTSYNAGYLRAERRFSGGLSLVAAYTFAKTMDDSGNADPPPQNTYNKAAEWGLSLFDARNRFTVGYVWDLPFGQGRRFASNVGRTADQVIGGWQISGITTFQSGSPFNLFPCCIDFSNTGQYFFALRPNINGPVKYLDIRKSGKYFDPSVFSVPAFGTFGNAARGVTIAPGIDNWDLTIAKEFHVTERAHLQFRADMFNAFNHAQFTSPYPLIGPNLPLAGKVTDTRPARHIQLALRVEF